LTFCQIVSFSLSLGLSTEVLEDSGSVASKVLEAVIESVEVADPAAVDFSESVFLGGSGGGGGIGG